MRDEYERLLPKLELICFPGNRTLYEAGEVVHYLYLLISSYHEQSNVFTLFEDSARRAQRIFGAAISLVDTILCERVPNC
jgi:hypothetical protein